MERASEGNRRDAPSVSFATEPLNGLFCKRRWRRVCYRHNWVRNALAASLNRMPGVQAVLEPMVTTRRAPRDQRRGDIKVIKSGTSWILDVGIICPGSERLVSKGTDTIPGKAAALGDGKKTKTYSNQANFVPFIVETGGRINAAGLHFLSRILPLEAEGTAGLPRRHGRAALRGISRALALQQGYHAHRLPRRYMRLIVLLKVRGEGCNIQSRFSGHGSISKSTEVPHAGEQLPLPLITGATATWSEFRRGG